MSNMLSKLSPSITNMIRLDHTHVMATFHQYEPGDSARHRKGLADNVCLALEIHAQLEEEIFYPALRLVAPDHPLLAKSEPEHNEMRTLITRLRVMTPDDAAYDTTFMDLMRLVIHHVADEETQLLPLAELRLADQLSDMGARMTKRRLELAAPRAPELAGSLARSMSVGTVLATASAIFAGGYLLTRQRGWTPAWARRA